jgi:AGZA family xanthine/uracil permease-like MFS transporter
VVLAIVPNIAAWGQTQVDGALAAAGTSAAALGYDKLMGTGVVYHGMELVGGGAVLAGLMLGAIAAFIIDRQFHWAGVYALGAAALAFFGFIHGVRLEFAASPLVALGYVLLAAICLVVARREEPAHGGLRWEPPATEEKAPAE